jgi:hypothetical protein
MVGSMASLARRCEVPVLQQENAERCWIFQPPKTARDEQSGAGVKDKGIAVPGSFELGPE